MSTEEPEPELATGAGDGEFSFPTTAVGETELGEGLGERSETTHNNKHLTRMSDVGCQTIERLL